MNIIIRLYNNTFFEFCKQLSHISAKEIMERPVSLIDIIWHYWYNQYR
jgi:hypothetical protein